MRGMRNLDWSLKPFKDLSIDELYELLKVRQEVFVVEQDCPYQDLDGLDQASYHLMGRAEDGAICAYARILPAGLSFPEVSIGRIITTSSGRGKGYGKLLLRVSIQTCFDLYGLCPIRIGAQTYLLRFYRSFGFDETGKDYLEDGIPHTEMLRAAKPI